MYKRQLEGPTGARVRVDGREVLMLTSNNYLGFANHPRIVLSLIHISEPTRPY